MQRSSAEDNGEVKTKRYVRVLFRCEMPRPMSLSSIAIFLLRVYCSMGFYYAFMLSQQLAMFAFYARGSMCRRLVHATRVKNGSTSKLLTKYALWKLDGRRHL